MSVLVARLLSFHQDFAIELQRFVLLWRYQHHVPPFTLWWRLVLKRAMDIVGSVLGIIITAPIMIAAAIAVKLTSKGPVFYKQERLGRFGESFNIYKFRSMRINAEAAGPQWASRRDDPRLTPIGGFLRRSHIDELPQLFNVFLNTMSLVGPRPERPCFIEDLNRDVPRYDERLLIKPGMTGLAQVHYRYDTSIADVKRKLRFDLLYVKRMCVGLDFRILFWTVGVVATGKGK